MVEESDLPPGYKPDKDESYMGPRHLIYFRIKLLRWRAELIQETQGALEQMRDTGDREVGDEVDRANREAHQSIDLRTRDRHRKPIGIERLEARPVATLSVSAQERHELRERQMAKHR